MLNTIITYLNNDLKTVIIIPSMFHDTLKRKLLKHTSLMNVSIQCIETFYQKILADNHYETYNNDAITDKLNIHFNLNKQQDYLSNNINYVNDLATLKNEFTLSNVSMIEKYKHIIPNTKVNFTKIDCVYEQILILDTVDIYPIHKQLLNKITGIVDLSTQISLNSNRSLITHDNTTRMLDYVINEIYESKSYQDTLIICDDVISANYLCNKFKHLEISFSYNGSSINNEIVKLKSLFMIISNQDSAYDIKNILSLFIEYSNISEPLFQSKILEFKQLVNIDYHEMVKQLYYVLCSINLFNLTYLNQLFVKLYLFNDMNNEIVIKIVFEDLLNQLNESTLNDDGIIIANSSYIGLNFENVYVIDASLGSFSANKATYLLDTTTRVNHDKDLISNTYYSRIFKLKQERLLGMGTNIYFHLAQVGLNNKPNDLAFFIKQCQLNPVYPTNYVHLTTKTILDKNNSLLFKNIPSPINYNLERLSSSALDTYFSCPYRYFVSYILKPREIKVFDSRVIGNTIHKLIEILNNYLIENKMRYTNLIEGITILEQSLEVELDSIQASYHTSKTMINQLRIMFTNMLNFHIEMFKYYEEYTDYKLDSSELELQVNYEDIVIRGKIDTLMSYENNKIIIDYKSSSKDFNKTNFMSGTSNQLVMYLYLLSKNDFDYSGAFYKSFRYTHIKSDIILDESYNKMVLIENNYLKGLLVDTPYISNFDHTFRRDNISKISSSKNDGKTTNKSVLSHDVIQQYFKVLESHINDIKNNFKIDILPYDSTSCNICSFGNICKVSKYTPRRKNTNLGGKNNE